ncbi:MAG: hypothetical protein LBV79_06920 [Candidatus Adiutrix sp.]|jgi:hypothetical protein|nr:hypothetical protein [Candidatus Adiutrix sp.]
MKKLLLALALVLWVGPAQAQDISPGTKLTPYEETRYGGSLWQVPREPYQSRYRAEKESSALTAPPAAPRPARASGRRGSKSPVHTAPPRHIGEEMTRQRFQSRMKWENEQRQIGERSRNSVPRFAPKPQGSPARPRRK